MGISMLLGLSQAQPDSYYSARFQSPGSSLTVS